MGCGLHVNWAEVLMAVGSYHTIVVGADEGVSHFVVLEVLGRRSSSSSYCL